MRVEEKSGIILLILGILIIIFSASSVLGIWMGWSKPLGIFHFSPLSLSFTPQANGSLGEFSKLFDNPLINNLKQSIMIPSEMINTVINFGAHLFLASFFINVGFKIASLGVKLIKK